MFGTISTEMEVKVATSDAWKVYGTLRLVEVVAEQLSKFVQKIDKLDGDGGAGTDLKLTFQPGATPYSYQIEKLTVVDDKNRVKVANVIEGGYLGLGMDLYQIRFEVIEKPKHDGEEEDENSCITKITVEYDAKDLEAAKLAVDSIQTYTAIMNAVTDELTKNKH